MIAPEKMMKRMELKEIRVSVFSNILETKLPSQFLLMDIVDTIEQSKWLKSKVDVIRKETDHGKRNDLKVKTLPVVCFSGTFSERTDNKLIAYNPIICLDLDDVKDLVAERNRLKTFPYVLSVFTSPTGTGLKVLVYHDLTDPNYHKALYSELGDVMGLAGRTDLKFDLSCSNVSRACFLSYDSKLWLNKNVEPYHFVPSVIPTTSLTPSPTTKDIVFPTTSLTDYKEIFEKIKYSHTLFEEHYNMYPGCRNKNLYILASFFRHDGIPEDIAADYLVAYYQDRNNGFAAKEIRETVESAYK